MRLTSESFARLQLSMVTEAGDPRLVDMFGEGPATRLISQLVRGELAGMPKLWHPRAASSEQRARMAVDRADRLGLRWLVPGDNGWPAGLSDLDHVEPLNGATGAPLGLWIRGAGDLARSCTMAVAVVGARDATSYGREVATDLAADLADGGVTVVSGAATGIDTCAHRGAIAMNGPTIAVLAGGADVNYPRANTALLERIAADSVIVSEQAPSEAPLKQRFLSRNRLIAALTGGTVVVEAARRSGSLNTLNWADQLGRVTMGIPGPVTSQASVGVHEALRTGKAMVVTNGREVIEAVGALGAIDATPQRAHESAFDQLSPLARRVLDRLPWGSLSSIDEICGAVGADRRAVENELQELSGLGLVNGSDGGWSLRRRADLLPGR